VALSGFLGSTLQQSRADASALGSWLHRPSSRSIKLELGGDALELAAPSEADRERLIEALLRGYVAQGGEESAAPATESEHPQSPAPPAALHVSATSKKLTVIEGEPARLLIRLGVTLVVLAIAIVAIVSKTSAEPAWGAVGAVIGYWLR
jgi:hypothetical protein